MTKIKIANRFGVIPNELLNNPDITFKAKGLYGYLQSKPDDWDFAAERIVYDTKESAGAIYSGLKELEDFGYLVRIKSQNKKGFWEIEYTLYENPTSENPSQENPSQENPSWDNSETKKKRNTNKEINKKEIKILFDTFWKLYPKKTGKRAVEYKYDIALKRDKSINIITGLIRYIKKWKLEEIDKQFIPNPTTWLNQDRWQDDIEVFQGNKNEHDKIREKNLEQFKDILDIDKQIKGEKNFII